MGAIGGTVFHSIKGYRNAPSVGSVLSYNYVKPVVVKIDISEEYLAKQYDFFKFLLGHPVL